ncbi:glycosyltransferase [Scytonema sp. NUACC21]
MSKRIVLATFGSLGDIHPLMALALELKKRGHQVIFATGIYHRTLVESEGLCFHPIPPHLDPNSELAKRAMDVHNGTEVLFREVIMPQVRDTYNELKAVVPTADLLVTSELIYTAPILAQKTGVPWVSYVLSPMSFFSAYDPPVFAPFPFLAELRPLGPFVNGFVIEAAKFVTRDWAEPLQELRAELGLPRVNNPIFEGKYSQKLTLALFSSAFAQAQPDWAGNTLITGFAFYDRSPNVVNLHELEQFLESGTPPIVFTLGSSAVLNPGNFYAESIVAAQSLGYRAVLLIGKNPLPSSLPKGIVAFDYLPYSRIFPHAAAIVHQGGIGTTGQALHAGRPMLVVPWNHDQPDNAARLVRLGVARMISRNEYTSTRAITELNKLLNEPNYTVKASEIGRQVRLENGTHIACNAIEKFLRN